MKMKMTSITLGMAVVFAAGLASAQDSSTNSSGTKYGLFNGLDRRSSYGRFFFPEPFLVDDSDLEPGEFRLDWLHSARGSDHADVIHPEIEFALGRMTFELEAPYERDVTGGTATKGFDNVDVGARYPFYQFVSRNGRFDTTFGAGIELGLPTTSALSHNTELVPKIFSDSRFGNFTAQAILGYSMLYGPGDDGGVHTFEYGFVFGYVFPHETFRLPGVDRIIPVAELSGENQLNKEDAGHNSLTADVGLRVNCQSIGRFQPRPGVAFVFPVDKGARAETGWGIMTSLVVEF